MTSPNLSSNFNLEDIRKIRNWKSEVYTKMTHNEIIDDISIGANKFLTLVDSIKCPKEQNVKKV
jgi:hypothetical protein